MNIRTRVPFTGAAIFVLAMTTCAAANAQNRINERFATVNGVRLHYLVAGAGAPVILLHGYAQNSHMWRPLIPELAKTHTVVAPDLRGFGQSSKPANGYDKKTMAQDIHALALSLGIKSVIVVGHDIGLMVGQGHRSSSRKVSWTVIRISHGSRFSSFCLVKMAAAISPLSACSTPSF